MQKPLNSGKAIQGFLNVRYKTNSKQCPPVLRKGLI